MPVKKEEKYDGVFGKDAKEINDLLLAELQHWRIHNSPKKMRYHEMGKMLGMAPSSVERIFNGKIELTIPRFVQFCLILSKDPVEVFEKATRKKIKKAKSNE